MIIILVACRGAPSDAAIDPIAELAPTGAQGDTAEPEGPPDEAAYPLYPTIPPEYLKNKPGRRLAGEEAYPLYPTVAPPEGGWPSARAYPSPSADGPTPLPPDMASFPSPVPFLSPTPELSLIARQAIAHAERLYGVSAEDLFVAGEEQMTLPVTQRSFWWVSLMNPVAIETYRVAVDEDGALVDVDLLEAEEDAAYLARYGKLDPALYDLLQEEGDEDELIPVAIWLYDIDHEVIDQEIKKRYTDVPLEGIKPTDETPQDVYDALYQERQAAQIQAYVQQNGTLVEYLQEQGWEVSFSSRAAPLVFASVPRGAIASLAERPDIAALLKVWTYEEL